MAAQRHVCLLDEMKRIPAKFISQRIRTELSKKLDPVKDLEECDYRYFASRNGLIPEDVMWLDSQKTRDERSSICMVLQYLSDKQGNDFTVYTVYKTLCDMNSAGQQVILDGMAEIRSLYYGGTRQGEEHSEPPSINVERNNASPPSVPGNDSLPPSYRRVGSQQSHHIEDIRSGMEAMNNLNVGCLPAEVSYQECCSDRQPIFNSPEVSRGRMQDNFNTEVVRNLNKTPVRQDFNIQSCGREAGQNSFYSSASNGEPHNSHLSYIESEPQDRMMYNHRQVHHQSPTAMSELKLPLPEPPVEAAEGISARQGAENSGQTYGQPVRPKSFPNQRPSSYKSPIPSRPISDANFCSHSGACNCFSCPPSFLPPSDFDRSRLPEQVSHNYFSRAGSDVSSRDMIQWNITHDQTNIKQRLTTSQGNRSPNSQHRASPKLADDRLVSRQISAPMNGSNNSVMIGENHQPPYFVFIVAADMDETEKLDEQVHKLSAQLQECGVNHVVVKSTSTSPEICFSEHLRQMLPQLTNDHRSVQTFIWECFRKAAKVLMLITPRYLCYADAYTEGAVEAVSFQQKLIRKIQEKLKEEFFNKKAIFRIWPVILHQLKANRLHIPKFLCNSLFYMFPHQPGTENLTELLRMDVTNRRSAA